MNIKFKGGMLLVMIVFTVFACDSDDTPTFDENLVGTWVLDATIFTACTNSVDNRATDEICDDDSCTKLLLTSDGRYELRVTQRGLEEVAEAGQTRLLENNISLFPDNVSSGQTWSYVVNGNTLLLTVPVFGCVQTLRYIK